MGLVWTTKSRGSAKKQVSIKFSSESIIIIFNVNSTLSLQEFKFVIALFRHTIEALVISSLSLSELAECNYIFN